MIDLKTLKELVKLMSSNELTELDLQDAQGERVSLKRAGHATAPTVQYVAPPPVPVAAAAPLPAAGAAPASAAAPAASDEGLIPVKSPMVGTYYASPSPDAKPFISVGGAITAESVVCIIEAMKVFNEIKAETSGTVAKILVSNGQAVEFGQTLFFVKP